MSGWIGEIYLSLFLLIYLVDDEFPSGNDVNELDINHG